MIANPPLCGRVLSSIGLFAGLCLFCAVGWTGGEPSPRGPSPLVVEATPDVLSVNDEKLKVSQALQESDVTKIPLLRKELGEHLRQTDGVDEATSVHIRLSAKTDYLRLIRIIQSAGIAGFTRFSLQIEDDLPVDFRLGKHWYSDNPARCFDYAVSPADREACWKWLRGGEHAEVMVDIRKEGIEVWVQGMTLDLRPEYYESCPESEPTVCPTSSASSGISLARYPWFRLHASLASIEKSAKKKGAPDRDHISVLGQPEMPVDVLRGFLRANCHYPKRLYSNAEAFDKVSTLACSERLFPTIRFGIVKFALQ